MKPTTILGSAAIMLFAIAFDADAEIIAGPIKNPANGHQYYLLSPNLTPEQSNQKALELQRDATWYPIWEHYNYHFLLTSLYEVNKALPENKKIKLQLL